MGDKLLSDMNAVGGLEFCCFMQQYIQKVNCVMLSVEHPIIFACLPSFKSPCQDNMDMEIKAPIILELEPDRSE